MALVKSFEMAPQGDYYEFGVYKGFSLWFATQLAQKFNRNNMRFFGFDSFQGLPKLQNKDKIKNTANGNFAPGCFTADIDFVKNNLKSHSAPMDKITLIKGFYKNSLRREIIEKYNMKEASIILIDCDIYSSTVTVLDFIMPLIQKNALILFDDWSLTSTNSGEQLAAKEWLTGNPNLKLEKFCTFGLGQGFIVKNI